MDTGPALLLKTTIKLMKCVKHLFGALKTGRCSGMWSREMGRTHSEPRVYPGSMPAGNFLTTAQTVGMWVEHSGPVELGRQRLDLGPAGAAETCRVLTWEERAAQSWAPEGCEDIPSWFFGLHSCRTRLCIGWWRVAGVRTLEVGLHSVGRWHSSPTQVERPCSHPRHWAEAPQKHALRVKTSLYPVDLFGSH